MGDFVTALLDESHDINEYAFALGALAHYAADNDGHRVAVNPSVGLLYPKLHRKFGAVVTYEDDPKAHLKTEFAFDVLQVARGHYAPDDYREYIGFEVSEDLLQKAFLETYGIEVNTREIRELHANAVIEILFTGMLKLSPTDGGCSP